MRDGTVSDEFSGRGLREVLSILIAEDEPLTRLDTREILEAAGHIVCGESNNGLKAVELAKQLSPDLAILDIKMPGLDGIEAAKALNDLNVPVLLLTAYSQPAFIKRAEKVNVYGYLVKPITERDLLPAVQIAYARWKAMQDVRSELERTQTQLKNQKIIAKAKALLAADKHISDYEAHQLLIRRSMDERIPLAELAKKIIAASSNQAV